MPDLEHAARLQLCVLGKFPGKFPENTRTGIF